MPLCCIDDAVSHDGHTKRKDCGMGVVPVTFSGMIYPKNKKDPPYPAVFVGSAWVTGLGVGGGPMPGGPGGEPPHVEPPPHVEHPIELPPDTPPPEIPSPPTEAKPPPPEGGWGWSPEYGWGYFPGPGDAQPHRDRRR
jgi:hypothetical protein